MIEVLAGENCYVSIEEADKYFRTRLNSDIWQSETDNDRKAQALITATKKIDRQRIKGRKARSAQPLAFPRESNSEVPERVKNACCEEAYAILKGIPKRIELQKQGVTAFSIGDVSESFSGKCITFISPEASEFLRPFLIGCVAII